MTEQQTSTTVTYIDYTFAVDSLLNWDEDPQTDVEASAATFAGQVSAALKEAFPEADTKVSWITDLDTAPRPYHVRVTHEDLGEVSLEASDDLVVYDIEPVVQRVWDTFGWVMQRETAAAADVVDLNLAIPPDLYDAIAETAERVGFGLHEWCLAALEIGVEGNLSEEEKAE